mgnify:FL=1
MDAAHGQGTRTRIGRRWLCAQSALGILASLNAGACIQDDAPAAYVAELDEPRCVEPLTCLPRGCLHYQPLEPAQFHTCDDSQMLHAMRGTCGGYAFGARTSENGGKVFYWNTASGELVATLRWAEFPLACGTVSAERVVSGDEAVVQACAAAYRTLVLSACSANDVQSPFGPGQAAGLCRAPLVCADYDHCDSAAATADMHYCIEGGRTSITEGRCGDEYWFRETHSSFQGETHYWSASGQLVALTNWMDASVYCADSSMEIIRGDASAVAACRTEVQRARSSRCESGAGPGTR